MRVVFEAIDMAKKLLGKQEFQTNLKYRPLNFLVSEHIGDDVIVRNMLTKEMIVFSVSEYKNIFVIQDFNYSEYVLLINHWFFVPEDFNEYELKNQLYSISRTIADSDMHRNFTILPTLDCNARCFYCFENGVKKTKMQKETANATAEYIIKVHNNLPVNLNWFGGEPLYNIEVIDYICDRLRKAGIKITSTMTTNGYLFDYNIIPRAVNLWNLKAVQITLDGTQNIYNKIKAYIYTDCDNPFLRVIDNIGELISNRIFVKIRLNMDRYNKDDLYLLIDQLSDRFKKSDYLHVYCALLFDDYGVKLKTRTESEYDSMLHELVKIDNYILKKGLSKNTLSNYIKGYSCKADSGTSYIILPNGNFTLCERDTEQTLMGNVFTGIVHQQMISWRELADDYEICRTCPVAPECIRLKRCPSRGHHKCAEYERSMMIQNTRIGIRNFYEKRNSSSDLSNS